MWKVLCLVAVFVISTVEGCTYKQSECPEYTVISSHSGYEIRSYSPLTWATTSATSHTRRLGQYKAFMRLHRYIQGGNDREQKMAMTVPVKMKTTEFENTTLFEMSFMLPKEFSDDPPVPNADEIKVVRENVTNYAVRRFDGYVWRKATWVEEAQTLADLVKDDKTVIKTSYYEVGYDAPFDLFDRRNEIWMVKEDALETNEV